MKKTKFKTKILISVALLVLFAALAAFMFSGGNWKLVTSLYGKDPTGDEVRDMLMEFGFRGYVTIGVLSLLQVVCTFIPAEPIHVLAGIAFDFPVAVACCAAGGVLGSSIIFLLYKVVGDRVRGYFTKGLSFDVSNMGNSRKCVVVIFLLYFLPAIPYGMICFLAASLGMKYRRYILVTLIGSLPSICIGVSLGYMTMSSSWIVSVSVFVVLIVLIILLMQKRQVLIQKLNDYAARPPYSHKTVVKKANKFVFNFMYSLVRIYYLLGGIRTKVTCKCEKVIKGPAIVLCNHGAFIDFYFAGRLLHRSYPHFVAARLYFYHKWLGKLIKSLGAFPKSMFALDMESMKNCKRVLNDGGVLAMMPEARLSTVGRFEDIQESTYSFLKKSGVPVYTVKISGDYFSDPKWGHKMRRGAFVEAEMDILFTPEELKELTPHEIKTQVETRLYYDEFQWLEKNPKLRYRSRRLAEGLENILTVCPVCGKQYTITTKKRDIFCEHCGKLTSLNDRYGFTEGFKFRNFAQWYDWQMELMAEKFRKDPDFRLESPVEFRLPSVTGKSLTRSSGRGVCSFGRDGLRYVGTRDGEEVEIAYPLDHVYRLLFGAGENFELYCGTEILYFVPDEKRSAVDWYMASVLLHREDVVNPSAQD